MKKIISTSFPLTVVCWLNVVSIASAWYNLGFPEPISKHCFQKYEANDIRISCDRNDQYIAIHEAYFTAKWSEYKHECPESYLGDSQAPQVSTSPEDERDTSNVYPPESEPCIDDMRLSFNKECSGLRECKFSMKEHHVAKCRGYDGFVVLRYACISEKLFHRFCSLTLTDPYGYFGNPAYPSYYPNNCTWKIEGAPGQTIQLQILDMDIRIPDMVVTYDSFGIAKRNFICKADKIKILDNYVEVFNACGSNVSNFRTIQSTENKMTVKLTDVPTFGPQRGVLFRYSLRNCPDIEPPKNGHMIFRNESIAHYECCKDYVFENTKDRERVLECVHGHNWNSTLPQCVPEQNDIEGNSAIPTAEQTSNDVDPVTEAHTNTMADYVSDYTTPIIVMVVLIVINAVIVFLLVKYKRRQKAREAIASLTPTNV